MAAAGLLGAVAQAADPDALWKIVHGRCVPNVEAGLTPPCTEVKPDFAVLKDINGATQFLLIPTARITGIESPAVLEPSAPNYFAAAWTARHYVEQRAGRALPRDAIALAINPPGARSQEQLHIHVDCLRTDVREALRSLPLTGAWTALPSALMGQSYAAMTVPGEELAVNPFTVLAEKVGAAAMGQYTVVVIGRTDGFTVLAGLLGDGGRGHGEDLQDHDCAVARALPPV